MVLRDTIFIITLSLGLFLSQTAFSGSNNTPCDATQYTVGCGSKIILSNSGLGNSSIAAPTCGNYAGGDVWVTILVPASGEVDIKTRSDSLTDIAMAVYRENTNCSGSLTYLTCDDNSGAGNMPNVSITGESPGTILYLRFWDNQNDEVGNFELELSEPSDLYCLLHDAVMYNWPADTCVQVTDAQFNQLGCAWYKHSIDFSQSFDNVFRVYFGNDDFGADGMTFVFHNDPQGNVECGSAGLNMGATGIQNALVIEFDSYNNFNSSEIAADHIAVWTSVSGIFSPLAGPVQTSSLNPNIEDGALHLVRLQWDAVSTNLKIYFDFNLRLSITYDFVSNVFGSKNVFWGSTGSTGGAYNLQVVCLPIRLSPLPVELINFNADCDDDKVVLSWSTATETNNDYFTIERSTDAQNFEKITTINGNGTINQMQEYQYIDPFNKPAYYRLLQTDYDGTNEYIGGVKYIHCSNTNSVLQAYPNPFTNVVRINLPSPVNQHVKIVLNDAYGRQIKDYGYTRYQDGIIELDLNTLSAGTYFLSATNATKSYQTKLVKINSSNF